MNHKITAGYIEALIEGPSTSKIAEVSNFQNFIQETLDENHYTFLQGSYKDHTSVSDINDVDIIALRKSTYSNTYSPHRFESEIPWDQIFSEIESKLLSQSRYTWTVTRDDKCIKVRGSFNADVVPAVKVDHDLLTDPIVIYSNVQNLEKINFPRIHHDNIEAKNKSTAETYKPTVRMFKNWIKNRFNNKRIISSFRIQALVYNVNDGLFSDDYPLNFILVGKAIYALLSSTPVQITSVCRQENILIGWDVPSRNIFLQGLDESLGYALNAYRADTGELADINWKIAFNL